MARWDRARWLAPAFAGHRVACRQMEVTAHQALRGVWRHLGVVAFMYGALAVGLCSMAIATSASVLVLGHLGLWSPATARVALWVGRGVIVASIVAGAAVVARLGWCRSLVVTTLVAITTLVVGLAAGQHAERLLFRHGQGELMFLVGMAAYGAGVLAVSLLSRHSAAGRE
jgi:hypothetical protein